MGTGEMIYPRTTCYNLLSHWIEQVVMPQLTSADARMVGVITLDTLNQLAKYEAREPSLVDSRFPAGLDLGRHAIAALRAAASTNTEPLADALQRVDVLYRQTAKQDGDGLVRAYQQLVAALDRIARDMLECAVTLTDSALADQLRDCLRDIAEWELQYHEAMMQPHTFPPLLENPPPRPLTAEALQKRLRAAPGNAPDITVTHFDIISGGMSKETFLATVHDSTHGSREWVARKTDIDTVFDFGNAKLSREYALVRRVFELGLPVAEPYGYFPSNADVDGDFYVMQKMEGKVTGTTFEAFAPLDEALLLDLAAYFARQHALPLEQFADYIREHDNPRVLEETCRETVLRFVMDYERMWKDFARFPSPGEAHTLYWLLNHVPPNNNRPVLVHADCTISNFLVKDNRISAVMDWEGAHFGDPAEDLAYVRDIVSRYMDWSRFLAHYTACGGQPINEASMNYYQCLSGFKNYTVSNKLNARLINRERADIRMLPVGLTYFPKFLQTCVVATRG
jgi:aminoglycoside phosphotransferase (APT) family kinase protein